MCITHSQSAHVYWVRFVIRSSIVVVVCGSRAAAEDGQEPDGSMVAMHTADAVAVLLYLALGPPLQRLLLAGVCPEAKLTEAEWRALKYAPFVNCLPSAVMLGGW